MEDERLPHDISDKAWAELGPLLPGQKGQQGGLAKDNRLFLNAVFWVLRTGALWKDLPAGYGKWGTAYRRFVRWRETGIWEKVLEVLIDDPDFEWLMFGAEHGKARRRASNAGRSPQADERKREGAAAPCAWPWMRMICRSDRLARQLRQRIFDGLRR